MPVTWNQFIVLKVFSFLELKDIGNAMTVSKQFKTFLPNAMTSIDLDKSSKLSFDKFLEVLGAGKLGNLRRLSVQGVQIGDEGATKLVAALAKGGVKLRSLSVADVGLTNAGITTVAALMKDGLEDFDLWAKDSGAEGTKIVAEAMKDSTSIRSVRLEGNNVGDEGTAALAEALGACQLRELNLAGNDINDAGAISLANAIKTSSLNVLDFRANLSNESAATAWAEALKVNKHLTKFNLSYNDIPDSGAEAIQAAMSSNTTCKWLDLGGNPVTGAPLIASLREHAAIIIQDENMPEGYLKKLVNMPLV